jgi:hypothetical protein
LQERNQLIVLKSNYPDGLPYSGMQDKFISVAMWVAIEDANRDIPYEPSLTRLSLIPCSEIKMDLS